MTIAAIMPCRGRPEQTIANARRLLATAGYDDWKLICVVDGDPELFRALWDVPDWSMSGHIDIIASVKFSETPPHERVGYWRSLAAGAEWAANALFLVNLANDLLPGQHWLRRGVDAYQATFGDGLGLLGFNGDSHEVGHSCHFLIDRRLLARYGGWPVWYDHTFGDTELCARAIADRCYAKAPWALLYHDHPYFGGADDAVYAEGRAQAQRDEQLYHERRRRGWTS